MTTKSINAGYIVANTESGAQAALFTNEAGERTWVPMVSGANEEAGAAGAGAGTGDNAGDNQGAAGSAGTGAGDTGNSDGDNNTGGSSSEKKEEKVDFTPEQQAKVEQIVNQTYARAMAASSKDAVKKIDALKQEMADKDAETAKEAKKKSKDQFADNSQQIAELNERHKEETLKLETQVALAKDANKSAKILAAISRHNVVDIADIAKLIDADVGLDENEQLVIQNPNGSVRIDVNENGAPMTMDAYMVDWLKNHPHHLKSSHHGAGSAGSKYGEAGQAPDFSSAQSVRNMSDDELDAALNDGVSIEGIHGQRFQFKGDTNRFADMKRAGYKKGT